MHAHTHTHIHTCTSIHTKFDMSDLCQVTDAESVSRDDIFMSNERLLRLLSDLVQSNLHTEDRISRRLVTLVNQSAGHSPQGGGADRGADRGVSDNGSGDEAAGGGKYLSSLLIVVPPFLGHPLSGRPLDWENRCLQDPLSARPPCLRDPHTYYVLE